VLKTEGQNYKQSALLKSYKNEIKLLDDLGLANSGFERSGPDGYEMF